MRRTLPASRNLLLALLLAGIAQGPPAAAADFVWVRLDPGLWSTDGNWNLTGFPDASDDTASLGLGADSTIDGNFRIGGLDMTDATLRAATGVPHTLSVDSSITWTGGGFRGPLTVEADDGFTFDNGVSTGFIGDGALFENGGNAVVRGTLNISNMSTYRNLLGGITTIESTGSFSAGFDSAVDNQGDFVSDNVAISHFARFDNGGSYTAINAADVNWSAGGAQDGFFGADATSSFTFFGSSLLPNVFGATSEIGRGGAFSLGDLEIGGFEFRTQGDQNWTGEVTYSAGSGAIYENTIQKLGGDVVTQFGFTKLDLQGGATDSINSLRLEGQRFDDFSVNGSFGVDNDVIWNGPTHSGNDGTTNIGGNVSGTGGVVRTRTVIIAGDAFVDEFELEDDAQVQVLGTVTNLSATGFGSLGLQGYRLDTADGTLVLIDADLLAEQAVDILSGDLQIAGNAELRDNLNTAFGHSVILGGVANTLRELLGDVNGGGEIVLVSGGQTTFRGLFGAGGVRIATGGEGIWVAQPSDLGSGLEIGFGGSATFQGGLGVVQQLINQGGVLDVFGDFLVTGSYETDRFSTQKGAGTTTASGGGTIGGTYENRNLELTQGNYGLESLLTLDAAQLRINLTGSIAMAALATVLGVSGDPLFQNGGLVDLQGNDFVISVQFEQTATGTFRHGGGDATLSRGGSVDGKVEGGPGSILFINGEGVSELQRVEILRGADLTGGPQYQIKVGANGQLDVPLSDGNDDGRPDVMPDGVTTGLDGNALDGSDATIRLIIDELQPGFSEELRYELGDFFDGAGTREFDEGTCGGVCESVEYVVPNVDANNSIYDFDKTNDTLKAILTSDTIQGSATFLGPEDGLEVKAVELLIDGAKSVYSNAKVMVSQDTRVGPRTELDLLAGATMSADTSFFAGQQAQVDLEADTSLTIRGDVHIEDGFQVNGDGTVRFEGADVNLVQGGIPVPPETVEVFARFESFGTRIIDYEFGKISFYNVAEFADTRVELKQGSEVTAGFQRDTGTGEYAFSNMTVESSGGGNFSFGTTNGATVDEKFNLDFGASGGSARFERGSVDDDGKNYFVLGMSPGFSPGEVTMTGDVALLLGSELEFEIGGLAPGTEFDTLRLEGELDLLGGLLQVSFLDGFEEMTAADDQFLLIDTDAEVTGAFDNAASGERFATADGLGWFVVYYGSGSPFDATDVIATDFRLIPEPGSGALLALGLAAVAAGRRRQR